MRTPLARYWIGGTVLTALVMVPWAILNEVTFDGTGSLAALFVGLLGILGVQPLVYWVLASSAIGLREATFEGWLESARRGLRMFPKMVWPMMAASLIGIAGLILLVIPGLWFAIRLFLVPALVVGEGSSAGEAIRGSWRRTRGHGWSIATVIVLNTLCSVLLFLAIRAAGRGVGLPDSVAEPIAAGMAGSLTFPPYFWAMSRIFLESRGRESQD